jgi:hypothetical protein
MKYLNSKCRREPLAQHNKYKGHNYKTQQKSVFEVTMLLCHYCKKYSEQNAPSRKMNK